jgi:hypothetical protein
MLEPDERDIRGVLGLLDLLAATRLVEAERSLGVRMLPECLGKGDGWAVDFASPSRTLLPRTQRLLRIIGKFRQIERFVRIGCPCRNQSKIRSIRRAEAASSMDSRPARRKVSASVSKTQVERPASYW